MRVLLATLALALALVLADARILLLHRLLVPDRPCPWQPRAGSPTLDPAPDFPAQWAALVRDPALSGALYQLAVREPDPDPDALVLVASIPACLLPTVRHEHFTLHYAANNSLYHLSYSVTPDVPCLPLPGHFAAAVPTFSVSHTHPTTPPPPELRSAPPLTPQGQPVVPAPEKSFLQKYWMYIALFGLVVLFTGGPDDGAARS